MTSPIISIIVPVYNVEKYLSKCIESILAQTFTNFELLLIDDGSPDNCGNICDEYSLKDARIKVFHKENGGVSSARNLGLNNAIGEWVSFIDSDDKVCNDWLEQANSIAMQHGAVELIQWGSVTKYKHKECIHIPSQIKVKDMYTYIKTANYKHTVWSYMFKNEIIKHNNIRFINTKYSEDQNFILKYLLFNPRIEAIDKALYTYIIRENSAVTSNSTMDRAEDNLRVAVDFAEYSKKLNKTSEKFITKAICDLFQDYIFYLSISVDYKKKVAQKRYQFYYNRIHQILPTFTKVFSFKLPCISITIAITNSFISHQIKRVSRQLRILYK